MYKKKKKLPKRKIAIISLLVICLILGFVANVMTTNRQLTVFEKAIRDSVLLVEKAISSPFEWIKQKNAENKIKKNLYVEYENLQKQLEDKQDLTIQNEELTKQLNELKSLLEINNLLSDYVKTNATVIGRDLTYFNDTIIIDKGQNDGIEINMPVVVKEGLIGKVISTTAFTATVRLITANNASDKVSVKIQNGEDYAYGIMTKYNQKDNTYTIEGIPQNATIADNSLVTTTGMGDIFPSGIIIGRVVGITTDNFDLAKVLEIKSDVNFNAISYVTVLQRNEVE